MNRKKEVHGPAPIALFVFRRPEHTRRTLESLAKNPEFAESPLFIFCDGAKHADDKEQVEATRSLVRNWLHSHKTIIERDRNWGLADSIIPGVTELSERYGKVIVVEDDLIVSPVFLHYLNAALERYSNEPKVMQISAHMFPVSIHSDNDAILLPFTTSWGWATWKRAWKYFDPTMAGYKKLKSDRGLRHKFDLNGSYPYYRMLKLQVEGKVDSWAIRWYLSVFFQSGLVLFPHTSLVIHDGYDKTATNAFIKDQSIIEKVWVNQITKYPLVEVDQETSSSVSTFFCCERSLFKRLRRIFRLE